MKARFNKQTIQRFVTFLVLLLIVTTLSLSTDKFLTPLNITNIFKQVSMVIIIASAANFVMISGGLDLSVSGVMALSAVVMANAAVAGYPLWMAMLFGVLIGVVVGFVNGSLVVFFRLTPVITTIGTWYITKGLAFVFSDGHSIVDGLPEGFDFVSTTRVGPIPLLVIIMLLVFVVFYIILNKTLLGKYTYAIGGNTETARLSGINVGKITCIIYILTSAMAGLAGVLMASRLHAGDPNIGASGIEFEVIVSIVIGGTSLSGGEGSLVGTFIGALIIGTLTNGMNLLGIGSIYQYIVEGAVLVIAVIIDLSLRGAGIDIKAMKAVFAKSQR